MNKLECHYGYQYYDGLNTDVVSKVKDISFQFVGSCVTNGLYFTTIEHIHQFLHRSEKDKDKSINKGYYLREVFLPHDDPEFEMVSDGLAFKANKIILGKRIELSSKELLNYALTKMQLYHIALYSGNSHILNWLKDNNFIMKYYEGSVGVHDNAYNWFITNGIQTQTIMNAIDGACENGDMNIFQELKDIGFVITKYKYITIYNSCKYGYTNILNWMKDNGFHFYINDSLIHTINYYHYENIRNWFLENFSQIVELNKDTDEMQIIQ